MTLHMRKYFLAVFFLVFVSLYPLLHLLLNNADTNKQNGIDQIILNDIDEVLLVTTAFWNVESKLGNRSNGSQHYTKRFRTLLNLRTNLAIYSDTEGLSQLFAARKNHPEASFIRLVVESEYKDFEPCKSYLSKLSNSPSNYTHPAHVPSIGLGCIWLSKLWLLQNSVEELPQYEWHLWLDIGLHIRDGYFIDPARFPNLGKLKILPKDKLIVSHSGLNGIPRPCRYDEASDYHFGRFEHNHCITGTSFLIHRDGLKRVAQAFQETLMRCLQHFADSDFRVFSVAGNVTNNASPCMSDQVIMSHLNPTFIHSINKIGYGAVAYDLLC